MAAFTALSNYLIIRDEKLLQENLSYLFRTCCSKNILERGFESS